MQAVQCTIRSSVPLDCDSSSWSTKCSQHKVVKTASTCLLPAWSWVRSKVKLLVPFCCVPALLLVLTVGVCSHTQLWQNGPENPKGWFFQDTRSDCEDAMSSYFCWGGTQTLISLQCSVSLRRGWLSLCCRCKGSGEEVLTGSQNLSVSFYVIWGTSRSRQSSVKLWSSQLFSVL